VRAGGAEPVAGARALGLACAALAVAAVSARFHASARAPRFAAARALSGGLLLAVSPPIAAWAIGGLEQPLLAGLLALAFALFRWIERRPLPPDRRTLRAVMALGACLALLALTRADAFVLLPAFGLAALLVAGPVRARVLALAPALLIPAAALAAHFAFRRIYYGDWLPNTAYAKVALHPARLEAGLRYVGDATHNLWPPMLLAALALAVASARGARVLRPSCALYVLAAGSWAVHVARVGGDIFPAFRQSVPLVVAVAFLVADAFEAALTRFRAVAIPVLPAALAGCAATQLVDPENRRAKHENWEWEGKITAVALKRAFAGTRVVVATDPAGCIPFWSELESLDLLGLNDRWLARHPPPGFGTGPLGHELADGPYTFARRPDVIVLCGPLGGHTPCWPNGAALFAQPGFSLLYRPYVMRTSAGDGGVRDVVLWARTDSSVVGIHALEGGGFQVPSPYLVQEPPRGGELVSRANGLARFAATLEPGATAAIAGVELQEGTWSIAPRGAGAVGLTVRARCRRDRADVRARGLVLTIEGSARVDVEIANPGDRPATFDALEIRPGPAGPLDLDCPRRARARAGE
jgi:hypothetical protein